MLADYAKKGAWPVAGGILDQTQAFMDLCGFTWSYESAYEAKQLESGGHGRKSH